MMYHHAFIAGCAMMQRIVAGSESKQARPPQKQNSLCESILSKVLAKIIFHKVRCLWSIYDATLHTISEVICDVHRVACTNNEFPLQPLRDGRDRDGARCF